MPVSSRNSLPSIQINFRASRWLILYLAFLFFALLASILNNNLSNFIKVICLVVSVFFLCRLFYSARFPGGLKRVAMDHHGVWMLVDGSGQQSKAHLLGSSRLLSFAILLRFALEGGAKRSVLLMPDSMLPDELRRLRQLLRVHASQLISPKE